MKFLFVASTGEASGREMVSEWFLVLEEGNGSDAAG